jgi:hypothetical protein
MKEAHTAPTHDPFRESLPPRQVFAADGPRRAHVLRAALAGGALLLAAWATALALGAFGGFGAYPLLSVGGQNSGNNEVGGSTSPAHRTPAEATAVQAAGQAPANGAARHSRHNSGNAGATAPSGSTQTATTTAHGKPAGSGTGTGSGKPIGTPDNGGTSGGGNYKGKALGLVK